MERKLKVAIIGGSGACGRELILHMNGSDYFGTIIIFTRRILPEWEPLISAPNSKLVIHQRETLDNMKDWDKELIKDVDTCFCCIGGRSGNGKEQFITSDYTYPLEFAQYTKDAGVPHYSIISTKSASSTSCFTYFKVKEIGRASCRERVYGLV